MSRTAWCATLLACFCVALAGCGDDDGGGDGAATTASSATDYAGLEGEPFVVLCSACSADLVAGLEETFLADFGSKTKMDIKPVDTFCCGIDKLRAQVKRDKVQWHVINFATVTDYLLAKEAGLLAPMDPKVVPLDELRDGTYDDLHYNEYRYGAVIGWNTEAFPGDNHPTSLADLLDTERFPGKRCLYKYPQFGGTLEAALLADGVAPEALYPLDVDRALKKLDTIKDDIVWWESGSQASQHLASGTCKLGAVWNGVAQAAAKRNQPIDIAWQDAIITTSVNAIPKGSPNMKAAQLWMAEQINNVEAEKELLTHVAYTLPLKKPVLPPEAEKFAPEGANAEHAIEEDDQYYFENSAEIVKRFNDWLVTGD
jgi:putative spermidine/putrescine transport system substrate-binding protein